MVTDVRIDAAIMSLQHSFIVDNYNCGRLGTLTVNGAIVQKLPRPGRHRQRRDDLDRLRQGLLVRRPLRYRSPPYFLNPLEGQVGSPADPGAGPGR